MKCQKEDPDTSFLTSSSFKSSRNEDQVSLVNLEGIEEKSKFKRTHYCGYQKTDNGNRVGSMILPYEVSTPMTGSIQECKGDVESDISFAIHDDNLL